MLKPCATCQRLSDGSYCQAHRIEAAKRRDARRGKTTDRFGKGWAAIRQRVLERDGFQCVVCGSPAKPGDPLHVDHIIPRTEGGGSDLENLRATHKSFNESRGRNGRGKCRRPNH